MFTRIIKLYGRIHLILKVEDSQIPETNHICLTVSQYFRPPVNNNTRRSLPSCGGHELPGTKCK
jgi:hypothetical protein